MRIDDVPRETRTLLDRYVALLLAENERQNLIARSTVDGVWTRHIADSLQLLALAPSGWQSWLDIGSGGGLPGLVVAIAAPGTSVILCEPRRLRREFLAHVGTELGLSVSLLERVSDATGTVDVISARAVAALDKLFAVGASAADRNTTWLLPKGRSAESELASTREAWQGHFTLVPSRTEPDAAIIVAREVRRKDVR